jgi:beta-lactamase superfamily II metal-dependent hydrolase
VDVSAVSKASNDDSLVIRIEDGAESFLLSADIEKCVENELVDEQAPLAADFLEVPHHGSKTSSTDAFVGAVAPRVAVVSRNQFGHPVDAVAEGDAKAGVQISTHGSRWVGYGADRWTRSDDSHFRRRPSAVRPKGAVDARAKGTSAAEVGSEFAELIS